MNVLSKNWNDLSDINEIDQITPVDTVCLEEIQAVIEKHQLTNKFGVALLHKHFDIGGDEILLEINDPFNKTLTITPVKEATITDSFMTTIWRFDQGQRYGCSYCSKDHHTS